MCRCRSPPAFPPENGRDGWADFDQNTGFEHELFDILRFMKDSGVRNVAFITTDVFGAHRLSPIYFSIHHRYRHPHIPH